MQHLDEGTIHSWLDGALGADEAARVEAHVAECRQCAAAVAEARGLIAASSRILTALDHLPRGVVPEAPPVKWHNRAMWRAAAAVLVVAVGSLVVVRNNEHKAGVPKIQPTTPITTSPSAISSRATFSGKPTADADFSGKSTGGAAQSNAVGRERALRNEAAATDGYVAAPSQIVGALAATPQPAAPSRVAEVTAMDVASEQLPLKVIGTPRRIGAKVTLYEVAPGDTVTLTELMSLQLEGVVVTGISSAEPSRLAGKAAATAPAGRADAAVVSAPDYQRAASAVGASAVSPSAAAPRSQVEVANGVTTISWLDATTHNMLKLSGRMPVERLQEIKRRIERERVAAAAKKSP